MNEWVFAGALGVLAAAGCARGGGHDAGPRVAGGSDSGEVAGAGERSPAGGAGSGASRGGAAPTGRVAEPAGAAGAGEGSATTPGSPAAVAGAGAPGEKGGEVAAHGGSSSRDAPQGVGAGVPRAGAGAPRADDGAPRADDGAPVAGPLVGAPVAAVGPSAGEIAELTASANRKMVHDDGKGCLADLERISALDPRLGGTLVAFRAQCEMLVGHCQQGKRMIADYYRDQSGMSESMATRTAESIAAMRCRGGDMNERDQLLRALWELSDGAYMNGRSAKSCRDNIALVQRLAPRVKPRDPEDSMVSGGPKALFHTGAACLARAGECADAWRTYRENFPSPLDAVQDPAQRRVIVEESFRSSIERCKDAKLP